MTGFRRDLLNARDKVARYFEALEELRAHGRAPRISSRGHLSVLNVGLRGVVMGARGYTGNANYLLSNRKPLRDPIPGSWSGCPYSSLGASMY